MWNYHQPVNLSTLIDYYGENHLRIKVFQFDKIKTYEDEDKALSEIFNWLDSKHIVFYTKQQYDYNDLTIIKIIY